MRPTKSLFVVTLFALPLLMGCGGGKATVKGKVSYQGRPIVVGSVMMAGPDGITFTSNIEPDGSYRIEGVTSGLVKIGVISHKPVASTRGNPESERPRRTLGGQSPRGAAAPSPELAKWFEIPSKYEEPTTSGITREIKGGENTEVNIDLP